MDEKQPKNKKRKTKNDRRKTIGEKRWDGIIKNSRKK